MRVAKLERRGIPPCFYHLGRLSIVLLGSARPPLGRHVILCQQDTCHRVFEDCSWRTVSILTANVGNNIASLLSRLILIGERCGASLRVSVRKDWSMWVSQTCKKAPMPRCRESGVPYGSASGRSKAKPRDMNLDTRALILGVWRSGGRSIQLNRGVSSVEPFASSETAFRFSSST